MLDCIKLDAFFSHVAKVIRLLIDRMVALS